MSGTYANAVQNNLPSQRAKRSAAQRKRHPKRVRPNRLCPPHRRSPPAMPTRRSRSSPLRSQARLLRLWIKPWEDADGDLYDQGYVYVQVDNGQWLIDHVQRQIRDAYAPLKAPPVQRFHRRAERPRSTRRLRRCCRAAAGLHRSRARQRAQ